MNISHTGGGKVLKEFKEDKPLEDLDELETFEEDKVEIKRLESVEEKCVEQPKDKTSQEGAGLKRSLEDSPSTSSESSPVKKTKHQHDPWLDYWIK